MTKSLPFKLIIITSVYLCAFQAIFCQQKKLQDRSFLYKDLPFPMQEVQLPVFTSNTVNITDWGAKNDGITSNTRAFAAAIAAVAAKGGGTVVIPEGLWLTGPIELKSNVRLYTEKGSIILFTRNFDEYPLVKTWFEGQNCWRSMSPIYAKDAENIAITGEGLFDGSGDAWRPVHKYYITESLWQKFVSSGGVLNDAGTVWYPTERALKGSKMNIPPKLRTEKESEEIKEFLRPVMVNFINCKKILLDGITFQNSPAWCLHPLLCENITVSNVTVENEVWASNGDAIDLESCRNALIYNSVFDAGDDAICMKSGKDEEGRKRGVPTENVIIYNCNVFNGHGGFVVGSEMSGGIRNIIVRHCNFVGTDNGLRFKSTRGRGGIVENVYISDINMVNIERDAILYDLYYMTRQNNDKVPPVNEGTPQFRNIYMKNIVCKGADRAILFQGLPEMLLKNIYLENAVIEARTGVFCTDAENIGLKNVQIYTRELPVMNINNATYITIDKFRFTETAGTIFNISGEKTSGIEYINTKIKPENLKINPGVREGAVMMK
jgi:polygalacturonase